MKGVVSETVSLPECRPIKVKASIEELKTPTVRVNNLPGNIAPRLDIVDGNSV